MKKTLTRVALGILFATSFSTVGAVTFTYNNTVSANTNKSKVKKNANKKSNAYSLKVQLTKDVNDYNSIAKNLSDSTGNSGNNQYALVSPYYSQNYSGMAESLHAMAHDMSVSKVDLADASSFGNGELDSPATNIYSLSDAGVQIYNMFSSRLKSKMSSSDYKKLSTMRDDVQIGKNQIANYHGTLHITDDIVVTQWNNIQSLYNSLGDNIIKLK